MFADLRVSNYAPRAQMMPHSHDEASLNIVVGGDFVERIGSGDRNYVRGHVAFCPAGVTHSQHFGARGARQIIFAPQPCWLDYLADCNVKLSQSPYTISEATQHLGGKLWEESRHDDAFAVLAREGIVLELIAALGRSGNGRKSGAQPPAWLWKAREFLHDNAVARPRLRDVANAAGRHEIHLAREFRRFYGTSVGAYLRQLKTQRAADLLRSSSQPIGEIALDCGFASQSHLCREFRTRFGVTPAQFRAESR